MSLESKESSASPGPAPRLAHCPEDSPKATLLEVSVARQELLVHLTDGTVRAYPVSTSRFGLGNAEGSLRTPLGRLRVAEKIGEGAPLWSIFRGRQPTGEIAQPGGEEDLVLTRILWLEGLDPDNANTKQRYIYFHGTNQEHLLGQPASHGCIRLRNKDMAEVFALVEVGCEVIVQAPTA